MKNKIDYFYRINSQKRTFTVYSNRKEYKRVHRINTQESGLFFIEVIKLISLYILYNLLKML